MHSCSTSSKWLRVKQNSLAVLSRMVVGVGELCCHLDFFSFQDSQSWVGMQWDWVSMHVYGVPTETYRP